MPNTIRVKRSSVASKVPLVSDLALGEIAINTYDGKVFIKKNNGTDSIVEIGAGASIATGDTPPSSPSSNQLWWDSVNGILKIYYTDANGSQWVDASPSAPNVANATVPQNAQNGNYTLALTDAGKHIYSTNVGAQTLTIPTNATVAFPIGARVDVINNGTTEISFNFSGVTVFQTGNSAPLSNAYKILSKGFITLTKVGTDTWWVDGDLYAAPYSIDYLVVAGGGSGGSASINTGTGGGGGGGLKSGTATGVTPGITYTITVGAGGAAPASQATGNNGGNSEISSIVLTAGGGGGGSSTDGFTVSPAAGGGSGGGGGGFYGSTVNAGGSGAAGQGNAGGNGLSSTTNTLNQNGGGGGGASAAGTAASGTNAGAGGAGLSNSITGSAVTYAGGGGGGKRTPGIGSAGAGGAGGGGAGGNGVNGTSGTANLGGGGGGCGTTDSNLSRVGGNGGSGVVILSIPTANYTGVTTGSPTVTTSGSNTILKFTSSGSYTA